MPLILKPILHLKGYQPDSFFYGFPKVSSGFYFEKLAWRITLRKWIGGGSEWVLRNWVKPPLFLPLLLKNLHTRLIYYRIYIFKTWGLIIKNVWHISVVIMDIIWNIGLRCRDRSFLWISEHNSTNKRRYFGCKNNLYRTKGTFVM